jgi:hypothetical protein
MKGNILFYSQMLVIIFFIQSCNEINETEKKKIFRNKYVPNKNISFHRNMNDGLKIIDSISEFRDVFTFQLNTTMNNKAEFSFIENFEPQIVNYNLESNKFKKIGQIGESNKEYLDPYQLYFNGIEYVFSDLQDRSIKKITESDADLFKRNINFTNFGITNELLIYHDEIGTDANPNDDSFFIELNLLTNKLNKINLTDAKNLDTYKYKSIALEGKVIQDEKYIANVPYKSSLISIYDIANRKMGKPIHTIDKTGIAKVELISFGNQTSFKTTPQEFINLDACLYDKKIYILSNIKQDESEYYIDVYQIEENSYHYSYKIKSISGGNPPSLIYITNGNLIVLFEDLQLQIFKMNNLK